MIYMVVFIPGIVPASYVIDTYDLGIGFRLGAGLNLLGAVMRILPWPFASISDGAPFSFIPIFIGQCACASAQTFTLAMPPNLANVRFHDTLVKSMDLMNGRKTELVRSF